MNIQQMMPRFRLCLVVLCTLAVAPAFAQTITHVPLYTFDGFGTSVSGAGDVDGDGFADVIVGSRVSDPFGSVDNARVLSGSDGSVLYDIGGFGSSVSDAGDVNGDGVDDLIVGLSFAFENNTSGSARVLSGVDGSVLYDFDGDSFGDDFGRTVSGAGDVNGDGFDDLVVGAHHDDNNGRDSGSVRVFSGIDGSVLYNFDGELPLGLFGISVSGAGDVNGDGFDDLIVGGPFDDDLNRSNGNARVLSGVDGSVLYNFTGDSNGDRFGIAVSCAGDVNGDGFSDLIIGAPRDDNNGSSSGSARVISGVDGSVLYNFDGTRDGDLLGTSVSGAGDVNGDGVVDLIVGAPGTDRLDLTGNGYFRVFSGSDGSVLYTFFGDARFDFFGSRVSGAGDVNGDGLADFIVTAPGSGYGAGYSRLFVSQITGSTIFGDCNQDGVVDFSDIPTFIAILQAGTFLEQADCNRDGAVTFADISVFITILQAG